MTTTTVQIVFNGNWSAGTGWNNNEASGGTGVMIADLVDSGGNSTGWSLSKDAAFSANSVTGNYASAGAGGLPEEFFDEWFAHNVNDTPVLTLSGLPVGATYSLKVAGHTNDAARDTTFVVTGSNEGSLLYDNDGDNLPSDPVEFTGTVGGSGEITLTGQRSAAYWYINGFVLTVTESSFNPAWARSANPPLIGGFHA